MRMRAAWIALWTVVATGSAWAIDVWSPMTTTGAPSARYDHAAVWTGREMIVWGGDLTSQTGGKYDPVTNSWTATSTVGAPASRRVYGAVWTGCEMIVWGGALSGAAPMNTGGRYNPMTDTWTPISTTNAPTARWGHTTIWTGREVIVWGGNAGTVTTNTGGRYDPTNDTWSALPTTGAPAARRLHTAVWTGRWMVVWGGENNGTMNNGGRYDPVANTWISTTLASAASARSQHVAVWTGREMLVFGGSPASNTGKRYDPQSDMWGPMTTTGAPTVGTAPCVAWTGHEMVVWGGYDGTTYSNTGARYSPRSDAWTTMETPPFAIEGRYHASAVWTGHQVLFWGGSGNGSNLNSGARYRPPAYPLDGWTAGTETGTPGARAYHTAVWTGREMIVWGGYNGTYVGTGGRYDPVTSSWTSVPTTGAPSARMRHTAIWTGREMIVWGGGSNLGYLNTGAKYDPVGNTWSPTSTGANVPAGRFIHRAVWTGREMIVWGGADLGSTIYFNDGGRYDPVNDTWTPVSTTGAPDGREYHAQVWTGCKMIVWGGMNGSQSINTGGVYDPKTDTWTPTSTTSAPVARAAAAHVWTGKEMVVWGGANQYGGLTYYNTGGRYDPVGDTWSATSTSNAPSARIMTSTAWTGRYLMIWGGYSAANNTPTYHNTGGRYDAVNNAWSSMTSTGAPSGRKDHTLVWTGWELIAWGGQTPTYTTTFGLYGASGGSPPTGVEMTVTPSTGLSSSGPVGGAFTPSSTTYTVSSTVPATLTWTASADQPWVTVSPSGGSIAPGASATVTVSINGAANSLTSGTYSATVTFTNTVNGVGNTTRSVSLTVIPAPPGGWEANLSLTPSTGLASTGSAGGPFSPGSATYTLTNTAAGVGAQSMNWTAAATQSWVTVSPTNGTLAPGAGTTVTVSINGGANALAAGSYSDTATFTNATNGNGNTTRSVSLTVNAPAGTAALSVSPSTGFNSAGTVGGPFSPSSATYTLTNSGGATLNWNATWTATWFDVSPSSGSLAAGAGTAVTVSINSAANSLASGGYATLVYFNNLTNGAGNTNRSVYLAVNSSTSSPQLSVTPAGGLYASGAAGGPFSPSAITYALANTGTGLLNFTASADQPWVTVSPSSGPMAAGSTASVTVTINSAANALAAGTYVATVAFTNTTNGAGNTSRTVNLSVGGSSGNGFINVTPFGGLAATGNAGGPFAPSTSTYTVTNTGSTSVSWTATSQVSWITLSSGGGVLAAGTSANVTVSINATGSTLPPATYSGLIVFSNASGGGGSTTRPVGLTVTGSAPSMGVTPNVSFTSSGVVGGPFSPSSFNYTITNVGSGDLPWSINLSGAWVDIFPMSGSLPPGESTIVTVQINTGADSLAAGSYSIPLTFTNGAGGSGNTVRDLVLTVSSDAPPAVTILSPTAGSSYSTPATSIDVSGTASDNGAVTTVVWSNAATGSSGTAAGTSGWIATIPLAPGVNVITVTAFDNLGNSKTAVLLVTRTVVAPGTETPPTDEGSEGGSCGLVGFDVLIPLAFLWARRRRHKRV